MAILEADVKFRASQRMTDFSDGGGLMSTVTIVDGVDNNLFDDITDLQRLFGTLSLRKVYGTVLSNNSDTYIGAHAIVDVPPTDSATGCFIFATGGLTTERAGALAALTTGTSPASISASSGYWLQGGTATEGNATVVFSGFGGSEPNAVGTWCLLLNTNAYEASSSLRRVFRYIVSITGSSFVFNAPIPWSGATVAAAPLAFPGESSGPRFGCVAVSPAGASASATQITVDSTMLKLAPVADGSAMDSSYSLAGAGGTNLPFLHTTAGFTRAFWPNDAVLIHSTIADAPAARANADVVNVGRTNLSRLRVIGNSGVVHASFVLNQPDPVGVGCTADLAAGTVTFTDVSGMSQPLTIEHRIEEMVIVTSISGNTLTLSRALSRAYPAGTRVSSLLMLGDLKARVTAAFAQNAWTGVWSDTVLGGAPAADYDTAGTPLVVTNQGAVNERWYCLFTNTTTFRLIGEQLGEIGTFGIGSPCAPTNPATGVPYFTIPSVGWGSGWAAGNVFRFNTAGANAPIWVGRSVAPSTPTGDDSVTLQLRGYVNT